MLGIMSVYNACVMLNKGIIVLEMQCAFKSLHFLLITQGIKLFNNLSFIECIQKI